MSFARHRAAVSRALRGLGDIAIPISPLSLDSLTRDYWGAYDAYAIGQLAPLSQEACYQPKFYKAPDSSQEFIGAKQVVTTGLQITPGSIIYGFYLPALFSTSQPQLFNLQITDVSLQHKWWDESIPSYFIGNMKPASLAMAAAAFTSFPNLLCAPYPVVGSGFFNFEIRETSGTAQRIEVVLGVLEVCKG